MTRKKTKTQCFTKRGSYFGNIWWVHSYKNQKDFTVHSDRELAHWILFLEFNQNVNRFDLDPPIRVSPGTGEKLQYSAEVQYKDGALEWRKVRTSWEGDSAQELLRQYQLLAEEHRVAFSAWSDVDFIPQKYKIMPLLRVAACLSVGKRYRPPVGLRQDAILHIREKSLGTYKEFLTALSEYDVSYVHHEFAKFYADGIIDVEISTSFFAEDTRWALL